MKDLVDSASAAARGTVDVIRRFAAFLIWAALLCGFGGLLVTVFYFCLRSLWPSLSVDRALTFATVAMVFPTAFVGLFGILFSVELESRRQRRNRS